MAKQFDSNVEQVFSLAGRAALKQGQTRVNTAALFDGVQRLFVLSSRSTQEFQALSTEIKAIFGKYGINSEAFNTAYQELYPTGPELPNMDVELEDDALTVMNILKTKAHAEQRQMKVQDLLEQLFADKTYMLYFVFSQVSDNFKRDYDAAIDAGTETKDLPPVGFDVNLLYSDMQRLLAQVTVREVKSLESEDMKAFLTNINRLVAEKKDFKIIGMKDELQALEVSLAGRTKRSAVIVGKAGVGKTSLIYELANRINNGEAPDFLKNKIIYELHMDAVVAGSQFRGQFEARLKRILDAVAKLDNVILFIDEFHTLVKAGGSGTDAGGDMTGGNIIKPYLSRNEICVIGATTNDEYNEYVEEDKAIKRRFKKVNINEPTREETIEIMRGVLPVNVSYFSKEMKEELLSDIYDLSAQVNISSANPDKSLALLESAFAYAKVCKENNVEVVVDDIVNTIALEQGVKFSKTRASDTREYAKEFLLGQDKAIEEVCKYLDMDELNLCDPMKPKCALLFAGPTGVGKTQLAEIIAEKYTGSIRNLVVAEGSSLMSATGVSTLFGADAGYVGYKKTSDFLAQVKQKPNCVVLFDEIEKADKAVFESLLNMLDKGFIRDKGGDQISFRNAIVIFTSNLGYGTSNHTGSGIMQTTTSEKKAITEINKYFSPEFIGRLSEVIVFNRLDNSIANKLIERYRKKYEDLSKISVHFTKDDVEQIKKDADIETLGARNLDHTVQIAFTKKAIKKANKVKKEMNSIV